MKLIFIYGPPGVGKLTVSKELAKMTGYKLFHNHLTYDPARALFEYDHPILIRLVRKMRIELLEAAAKENINGVIVTFVYDKPASDLFVKQLVKVIKKHKGTVHFVELKCSPEELFKRIKDPSRKLHHKLTKIKLLRERMTKMELFATIPFKNNVTIDNTKLTPKKTAEKIKKHFKL